MMNAREAGAALVNAWAAESPREMLMMITAHLYAIRGVVGDDAFRYLALAALELPEPETQEKVVMQ